MREVGDQVLFLHRLQPGGADRSYGIEVGRLAGLPDAGARARARPCCSCSKGSSWCRRWRRGTAAAPGAPLRPPRAAPGATTEQLALFAAAPHPVVTRLAALDTDSLTPLQALQLLAELRAAAAGDEPGR